MNGAKSNGASNHTKGTAKDKKSAVASRKVPKNTSNPSSSSRRSSYPPSSTTKRAKDLWSDDGFFEEAEDLESLFDSSDDHESEQGDAGRDDRPSNSSLYEDELFGDFDLEPKQPDNRTWRRDYNKRRGTHMSFSDSPHNEIDELYNQLHRKRKL